MDKVGSGDGVADGVGVFVEAVKGVGVSLETGGVSVVLPLQDASKKTNPSGSRIAEYAVRLVRCGRFFKIEVEIMSNMIPNHQSAPPF